MASQYLLAFAAFLASIASVCLAQEPAIRMEVSPKDGRVNAGDRLIISCFAENFGGGRLVKLYKYQPQAAAEVTLFSNDAVEGKYRAIDRFSLTLNQTNPDKVAYGFYFAIAGAEVEDSGTYRCAMTNSDVEDSMRIDIIEPPLDIKLFVGDTESEIAIDVDGQVLELEAGVRREVRCTVTGGNPAPDITFKAGDEDITDKFDVNARINEHETGIEGMFRPEADVSVVSKDNGLKMDYAFNGKMVGCHAYVAGEEEPELSLSFMAKFMGVKPEFLDCPREVTTFVNTMNVNLTCKLKASPEPSKATFSWLLKSNDTKTLSVGKEDGHYTGQLTEVDGEVAMVLRIDRITPQAFRKYTFTAENDLGTAEVFVNLTKDPADPYTDGAQHIAVSATLLAFLVALQCYMHL